MTVAASRSQIALAPRSAWSRFLGQSRTNFPAIVIVAGAIIMAMISGLSEWSGIELTSYDAIKPSLSERLLAPTYKHPMGTDHLGRDVFSRTLMAARPAMQVAMLVLTVAVVFGTTIGLVAGFFGGYVDEVLMRIVDLFLAFPALILAAAISTTFGGGVFTTSISLAAIFWPWYARVTRSKVLSLREYQFVRAAQALGASNRRLIFITILPIIWPTVIVQAASDVGFVMLATAGLSFLGLGTQPPAAEWGSMIVGALPYQPDAWWMAFFPGLALGVTALGFNLLGDGLRDFMDVTTTRYASESALS